MQGKETGKIDKKNNGEIYGRMMLCILSLCMAIMFYGMYMHDHYGLDAYGMVNASGGWPFFQMMSHGRPFMDIVMHYLFVFGINPVRHQALFALLLICTIAFAIGTAYSETAKRMGKIPISVKIVVYIACSLAFLNFCFQEWFNFSDGMVQFTGGLLFAMLAVRAFLKDKVVLAFILAYVSLGFYQAVLGIFITWTLIALTVGYLGEGCGLRLYFKKSVFLFAVAGGASACNILTTKLAQSFHLVAKVVRSVKLSPKLLADNFMQIMDAQALLFQEGYYHMPDNFLLAITVILLSCLAVPMLAGKKYRQLLAALAAVICSYSTAYLPFLLSETVWMPPRTLVPIFSSMSAIVIFCVAASRDCGKTRIAGIFCRAICGAAAFAVWSVNLVHVQKETLDLFVTNELDYYICQQIGYKIGQYEQKSGKTVDTVRWHTDTGYVGKYPHVTTNAFDTNSRAFNVAWSWYGLFEYALGRNFTIEEMSEDEYQDMFAGKDWDYFIPDEELAFQGNVMYFILN